MSKVLLIWSGGLDSTSLLFHLRKEGHDVKCVHFYYGSKHNKREREAVTAISLQYRIDVVFIDLDFIGQHFKSALLQGGEAIPEGHYADDNMKMTVVPFRNGIMIAIATGLAESRSIKEVYLGAHAGDHTIYPDCREVFIEAMNQATMYGTADALTIRVPFQRLDKGGVCSAGHAADAPLGKTWTCYKGLELHCGKCGACVERKEAFAQAGIPDPTEYAKPPAQNLTLGGIDTDEGFGKF